MKRMAHLQIIEQINGQLQTFGYELDGDTMRITQNQGASSDGVTVDYVWDRGTLVAMERENEKRERWVENIREIHE